MQKQQAQLPYFLNSSIIYKYDSKKLLSTSNSTKHFVFLTESQIHIINPSTQQHITTFPLDTSTIMKYVVSSNNNICILYVSGVMEVRGLDAMGEVLHRWRDVEIKGGGKIFPQLYWRDQDIYVLTENKLELFDLGQKQRKVYLHSDLMCSSDTKNLLGLVESKLLDRQRIIIMQFVDKMTFNIVPISITQMPIPNVTKFLSLYSPKHKPTNRSPPRQYLAVIIENKFLQIYNIINMKQILQIQYEQTQHEIIDLNCDMNREFLLVTFVTKKNKVTRNILYKINSKEYYQGKNYFREDEKFLLFEVELEIKERLVAFQSEIILSYNKNYLAIELCHARHYMKRSKGEIVLSTLVLNYEHLIKQPLTKCKTKSPDWRELRQWKDIITSYIEMKNTLDMIDFNFSEEEENFMSSRKAPLTQQSKKQPHKQNKTKEKAIILPQSYNKQLQMEMEVQKYEKLKTSLLDGAHKFKNQVLTMKSPEDQEKKLEEEFYKFMSEYLKEQKLDFDTEMLFETIQDKKRKEIQSWPIDLEQDEQNQQFLESLKDVKANNVTKRKEQRAIPGSKSSQRLVKNTNIQSLSRTKSSANEEAQVNKNNSFVSSFSDRKLQIATKSQQNVQRDKQQCDVFGQQHDELAIKITEAIMKAFQPLEKRIQKLDQQLTRTQSIHIAQLQKCQRSTERQAQDMNNIDMTIKGYCTQLLYQFDKTLQSGLRSYWQKIQQIDKKAARDRDKSIHTFGTFIDQQIRNREQIFDQSRFCIENTLAHLRKKMGNMPSPEQEEDQEQEQGQGQDNWILAEMKRRSNEYAFDLNLRKRKDEWEDNDAL